MKECLYVGVHVTYVAVDSPTDCRQPALHLTDVHCMEFKIAVFH